ncbi:MAG TPA: DUF1993 domain-containing protein [Sphingomonas sp.]
MTFSLHAATVPGYRQMLGSLAGLLDKAESWCGERGIAPANIIGARLAADMHPFSYQVKSAVVHSVGAIAGARQGSFSPDTSPPPETFAALKARVAAALATLAAIEPGTVDGLIGKDVRFSIGERGIDFTAEDFLLSFSQPNFYFHVTTAYAILRANGLPIGKRDYLGAWRKKA